MERLEFVGAVGVESESCWSDWSRVGVESCWSRAVEIVVILVSSERAKKADDSCISILSVYLIAWLVKPGLIESTR